MAQESTSREMLGSRLGFLLIAAGCAVGLGNVWRFPFITGEYGGAWFLLIFLVFQIAVMPIMILEFAIGRAARSNMGSAFEKLAPQNTFWRHFHWIPLVGSYCLLMFYTVITGWMMLYCWYTLTGTFTGMEAKAVGAFFGGVTQNTGVQIFGMTLAVAIGFGVCALGVQKGIEKVVKVLMVGLFLMLAVLVVHSLSLPGAGKGLEFYLMPDYSKIEKTGFLSVCSAALNQAFFTLSIGVGSMCIFGSYFDKKRSLAGEAVLITTMDFLVALMAGLVIFPACFSFGVQPGAGPGLVFVTLPNIFASMSGGIFWGTLFFAFMAFAALTTVIAVVENIIAYCMERYGMSRGKSTLINFIGLWVLSLPCALGFNVLSFFQPFGPNSCVLDLEDFIISNNILPLGGLLIALFCSTRRGWGWEKFVEEANTGLGMKVPGFFRFYLRWILPIVILFLFVMGYVDRFCK